MFKEKDKQDLTDGHIGTPRADHKETKKNVYSLNGIIKL
jgi:hypothetical protein